MKIRGWLLTIAAAIAIVSTSGSALAATGAGDLIYNGTVPLGSPLTSAQQYQAAAGFTGNGVSYEEAVTVLITGSRGTFLNSLSHAYANIYANPATRTATGIALYNTMQATGTRALASLRIASGQVALSSAHAADATISSIAGPGGVMQQRFAYLAQESSGLAQKFGANSAMAAAYMNCDNFANRIWASPMYLYQDMDQKDGYAAYKYKAWGGTLGYDHNFGGVMLGAAFTYTRGDYDEKGIHDDNTIDNYGLSLYASYRPGTGIFGNLYGGYNYGKNDMNQYDDINRGWQRGDSHTNSYWVGGNLGYDFNLGQGFRLSPSVGLLWSESTGSSYNSTGVYDMHVGKIKNKGLLMPIDLAATYTAKLDSTSSVQLRVSGGYAYNFKNDGAEGDMRYNYNGALPVVIQGVKPGRNSWNVGGGITYTKNNFDIGVDYRYRGQSKYTAHQVNATVGLKF